MSVSIDSPKRCVNPTGEGVTALNFIIPVDYKSRIMAMYDRLEQSKSDTEVTRRELEGRLGRIKKLYEWGDKPEEEYLSESKRIKEELNQLTPEEQCPGILTRLQDYLRDMTVA